MSLPFTTSTAVIERPTFADGEGYTVPSWSTVGSIRAVMSGLRGKERSGGGVSVRYDAVLYTDPGADVAEADRVTIGGQTFLVLDVSPREGFGLDHIAVGLARQSGEVRA